MINGLPCCSKYEVKYIRYIEMIHLWFSLKKIGNMITQMCICIHMSLLLCISSIFRTRRLNSIIVENQLYSRNKCVIYCSIFKGFDVKRLLETIPAIKGLTPTDAPKGRCGGRTEIFSLYHAWHYKEKSYQPFFFFTKSYDIWSDTLAVPSYYISMLVYLMCPIRVRLDRFAIFSSLLLILYVLYTYQLNNYCIPTRAIMLRLFL
jgi:hypothetical protein